MPVLAEIKAERFANNIAEGMTGVEAYKAAGYRGLNDKRNAENLRSRSEIKARIKELTARISKSATNRAASKLSLDKEMVLRGLLDNIKRAEKVKGGSSVVTRCWELIGKHLGMFQDADSGKPVKLEDLSTEDLKKLLEDDPKPPAVVQ